MLEISGEIFLFICIYFFSGDILSSFETLPNRICPCLWKEAVDF